METMVARLDSSQSTLRPMLTISLTELQTASTAGGSPCDGSHALGWAKTGAPHDRRRPSGLLLMAAAEDAGACCRQDGGRDGDEWSLVAVVDVVVNVIIVVVVAVD